MEFQGFTTNTEIGYNLIIENWRIRLHKKMKKIFLLNQHIVFRQRASCALNWYWITWLRGQRPAIDFFLVLLTSRHRIHLKQKYFPFVIKKRNLSESGCPNKALNWSNQKYFVFVSKTFLKVQTDNLYNLH